MVGEEKSGYLKQINLDKGDLPKYHANANISLLETLHRKTYFEKHKKKLFRRC